MPGVVKHAMLEYLLFWWQLRVARGLKLFSTSSITAAKAWNTCWNAIDQGLHSIVAGVKHAGPTFPLHVLVVCCLACHDVYVRLHAFLSKAF